MLDFKSGGLGLACCAKENPPTGLRYYLIMCQDESCKGIGSSKDLRPTHEPVFVIEKDGSRRQHSCCQNPGHNDQTHEDPKISYELSAPPASTSSSSTIVTEKTYISMSCCEGSHHSNNEISECRDHGNITNERNCCSQDSSPDGSSLQSPNLDGPFIVQINPGTTPTHESITFSIQGMTCTGCEKSLFKTLASYAEISDIKTNLLLAQADFALMSSDRMNPDNVASIVGRRTGFACSRVIHIGGQLDLIMPESFSILTDGRPFGVGDISFTGKHRIRVSYRPNEIGARDIISNSYFRGATLAPPSQSHHVSAGKAHLRHETFMTLLSAALTIPVLVLSYASLPDRKIIHGGVCLALATVIQTFIAGPFYPRAVNSLIVSRMVEMDMLVVLSTTTAYVYSLIAYIFLVLRKPLSTPQFFETSTLLVTLIMVGRTISAYARQKAVESISFESKQESKAIIVLPGSEHQEIDARLLQYEDVFMVFPEGTVVTDGVIIEGRSEIDESLITGESTLIAKEPGMSIIAGSINHSGILIVKLSSLPCDNTIKKIGVMVDEATSSKPKVQELADKIAGIFVPAILVITCLVFGIWVLAGKIVQHKSTTTACINAMTYAISVLIVSCPCAIGLAVPMVAVIAGGVGARHGLILKSAESLEIGRKVNHVVFDKTGTLTDGHLSVLEEEYLEDDSHNTRTIILGLTSASEHPVSMAITSHYKEKYHDLKAANLHNIRSTPGCGIEAEFENLMIKAGNPYWLEVENNPIVSAILEKGLTISCITQNNTLTAIFGLKDKIRSDALTTITTLRNRNIEISLLSGDNEKAVNATALHLGIPLSHTRSRCTPQDKQLYILSLISPPKSKSKNTILFCGDGTNDAPALAQASIGIHINRGTSVAQSAADVILMRPFLKGTLTLMDLSQAFYHHVFFNFAWSFLYNIFAILLAAGAFPNARIEPRYAGLGELCSVLPVVAVALGLRLKRF